MPEKKPRRASGSYAAMRNQFSEGTILPSKIAGVGVEKIPGLACRPMKRY
jgi:hypothetical protein